MVYFWGHKKQGGTGSSSTAYRPCEVEGVSVFDGAVEGAEMDVGVYTEKLPSEPQEGIDGD